MPRAMNEASLRHLGTLFGGGSGLGMSDGQLLERFVTREGTRAERAFEILVERHGPMVQRVARSIVSDRDLADDAFQTVFVTLAKRARSLWVRDSIGPWLHAVTVRVATRMRADQTRQRRIDAKAAALMASSFEPGVPDDLGAALHEEIARLPEAQRLPIVLCLVEGLTHDQAADRLGWPVGTIRSRLARGRERLRSRLDRRGLAPSPGVLIGPALLMRSGSEAIRGSLLHATVQNAVSATQGGLIGLVGTVPAGVIAAAVTLIKESTMIHRVSALLGIFAAGTIAVGVSIPAQSKPQPAPAPAASPAATKPLDKRNSLTKIYKVGDLVLQSQTEKVVRETIPERGTITQVHIVHDADFEPLIDLLTDTVAPGTWTVRDPKQGQLKAISPENQPAGSITLEYTNTSLIVRHTSEVHDEIAERLHQLRRVVGPLISVATQETLIAPELQGDKVIEERVIGPNLTGDEIVGERVVGPASTNPDIIGLARPIRAPEPMPAPDQRIESLERKLDAILDELQAIRKTDE